MESMQNSNKFDHKIKSKFDDFTPSVPADLWNKIESQLDATESIEIKSIKRSNFSFLAYGAVAATILIAFVFWKFGDSEVKELQKSSEVHVSKDPSEEVIPLRDPNKNNVQPRLEESIVESNHFVEVRKSESPVKEEYIKPQLESTVNVNEEASLESISKGTEYSIAYVETIHAIPLIETPILIEEVLPFQNKDIILQDSLSLQEEVQEPFIKDEDSQRNKRLGVSTLLNLLAKGLTNENGNSIEFSESEEGILKLDIKLGLAKSKD